MIIKRTAQKARKNYVCEHCGKVINKGTIYHRLFGAAFSDDPKYEIMFPLNAIIRERLKNERRIFKLSKIKT